jgi:hypothetical protein
VKADFSKEKNASIFRVKEQVKKKQHEEETNFGCYLFHTGILVGLLFET